MSWRTWAGSVRHARLSAPPHPEAPILKNAQALRAASVRFAPVRSGPAPRRMGGADDTAPNRAGACADRCPSAIRGIARIIIRVRISRRRIGGRGRCNREGLGVRRRHLFGHRHGEGLRRGQERPRCAPLSDAEAAAAARAVPGESGRQPAEAKVRRPDRGR